MFRLVVASLLAALCGIASAQGFPSRPLRILVPFPPGGGTDVAARALGVDAAPGTPEELEAWVRSDIAHYRRMIELTGAKPEGR